MDSFSKDQRSKCMSKIRSKNTSPELLIRKKLSKNNIRYRLHKKDLPGSPDIVISESKTAIFVNGCFWHQHKNCKRATRPKTNKNYWLPKLDGNAKRQRIAIDELKLAGWKPLIIWECEATNSKILNSKLRRAVDEKGCV